MIVGLGGIGTNVLQHVVRMGVEKLTLIDPDLVDESNLNRQVAYSRSDIGRPKVDAAKEYFGSVCANPFDVVCIQRDVLDLELADLEYHDLILVSADNCPLSIRRKLAHEAFSSGISYAFAGYHGDIATVGPLVFDKEHGCGACALIVGGRTFELIPLEERIPPSGMAGNALIASVLVDRWIRHIACLDQGGLEYRIDLSSMSIIKKTYQRILDCPVCGIASRVGRE